jgi:hypothetical protein
LSDLLLPPFRQTSALGLTTVGLGGEQFLGVSVNGHIYFFFSMAAATLDAKTKESEVEVDKLLG